MSAPPLSLAAIRQPAFLYGPDGRIAEANDLAESLAGRPLAGCSAAAVIAIFGHRRPDGMPLAPAELPACLALAGEEVVDLPFTVTASDGRSIHILATASPIRDGAAIVGALTIWHDMTVHEQMRGELAESEAKYRNLVELAPDAILIHQDGTIVFANPAAAAMLGADRPKDLVGRPVLEIVHPGKREHVEWNIEADLRGEESPLTAVDLLRPDGTTVTVQGRGAMIPFGGRPAIQVVLRDVTEEKRAEAALQENERRHTFLLALGDRLRELADVSEITTVASELVGRHLGVNGVVYCEIDAAGECATVRADWTDGTVPGATGSYRMDDFGIGDLYRQGLVRRTEDVTAGHDDDVVTEHCALRIRASLGVPIRRGGRLAAVLAVHSARPRAWTDAEIALVREAGHRVWSAVERARAGEALRRSEERQTLLAEVAARLLATEEPQAVVDDLCRRALDVLDCDVFFNFLVDRESGRLLLNAYGGIPVEEADRIRWLDFGAAVCGCVARDGSRIVAEAIPENPDPRTDLVAGYGVRAYACHPLMVGGRILGTLSFGTRSRDRFTDDELATMLTIADLIAVAMQRIVDRDALRESEEWLRLAQESANIAVWDRDVRTGVVTHTPEFLRLYGLEKGSVDQYEAWQERVHPDDIGRLESERDGALVRGESFDTEFRIIRPSGETRWLQAIGRGIFDESGTLVRVLGVNIDITARKAAEEALAETVEQYRQALNNPLLGYALCEIVTDCAGKPLDFVYLDVNPAFEAFTGLARDRVLNRRVTEILLPGEVAQLIQVYGNVALTGEPRTFQYSIPSLGRSYEIAAFSPQRGRFVAFFTDITARKEAELELEQNAASLRRSNEELLRFAYVASHDLQEPLRPIISFSQLLERRYKGKLDADADDYINFIVEGGKRMQSLIQDLLQFSRLETRALPLAPTDAAEAVADALRLLETSLREANGTVEVGALPTVLADRRQLEQIFVNLIGNAIKYRRPDVPLRIRVAVERRGGMVEFAVADNGIGIEAEYFDRIFEMFRRLHTQDQYGGTGIGLAVVKKIVERHGGKIRVESTPGEGSTFYFTLPAA